MVRFQPQGGKTGQSVLAGAYHDARSQKPPMRCRPGDAGLGTATAVRVPLIML